MATEMTREELFNKIWSRPMTKVAADLGISDVALKKICDKLRWSHLFGQSDGFAKVYSVH